MSNLYSFRCSAAGQATSDSTLVIFCPPGLPIKKDISDEIAKNTRISVCPESVYFICAEDDATELLDILDDDDDCLLPILQAEEISILSYSTSGEIKVHGDLKGSVAKVPDLDIVFRQGLTQLFVKRGGELFSGFTSHFVKPSKKKDRRFLRASHALSEGAEIFFTAIKLLPYVKDSVRTIHLDTSAIASVVMAALLIRKGDRIPAIRTFHSYEKMGLHDFNKDELELVVISASQSGAMADDIRTLVGLDTKIVTIFSSTINQASSDSLCDLTFDSVKNPLGLQPLPKGDIGESSRPIRLVGEHFLREPEPSKAVLPGWKQNPDINTSLIGRIAGKQAFICNFVNNRAYTAKSIWVDAEKLLQTENYKAWISDVYLRYIPSSTDAIVHIDGSDGSKKFAQDLYNICSGEKKGMRLVRLSDIDGSGDVISSPPDKAAIVIAGGITGHGDDLLSVSRALRDWAPESHRVFLSPMCIPSSKQAFTVLKQNLCQPSTHIFNEMNVLVIDRMGLSSSWEQELLLLSNCSDELPEDLAYRLENLRKSEGLRNNLLLDGKLGQLKLRKNFAFWPENANTDAADQSDVFVTISCLLQNMRTNPEVHPMRRIINDANTHSVIAAGTFARYNDGIIQASLLRAAYPVELNYKEASEESRVLSGLVVDMVRLANRQQGEALTEFLLALATKRLQLRDEDNDRVKSELCISSDLSPAQMWFSKLLTSS